MSEIIRIFLVEDEPTLQLLYQEILTMQGFSVVGIASNGEEAVEMFKAFERRPDIIIMDHRMPLKDGLEATKEIMVCNHKAKIIFASADKNISQKALKLGAIKFLLKPFRIDALIDCIKESTPA